MSKSLPRFVPFAYGFRPFFLLAGIQAVVSVCAWLWLYRGGMAPLAALPPQYWHVHEMIYGFIVAAIAGFMLTAVPSWTGTRGFAGRPLQLLVFLWLAGRVAFMFANSIPFWVLAVLELAFLPALIVTLSPSLLRTINRNTPLLLVLLVIWLSDLIFVAGLAQQDVILSGRGLRVGLDLVLVLITVIGGRIVPAFTGSALRSSGIDARMRSYALLDRTTIALMLAFAIADIAASQHALTGYIAAVAALAQVWRLSGWQGWRTGSQPVVWILHVAYLWLPIGLCLKALSVLGDVWWAAYWQHAFGAGAAGTMILAVMTRASLGHTGRSLQVHKVIAVAYALLVLSVTVRVFGPALLPMQYQGIVVVAGSLWVLAFAMYLVIYTPILLRPRVDGKAG